MKNTAQLLFNVNNSLGEGPLWHPAEKRLYWVDILGGDLYKSNQALTGFDTCHFEAKIGAFGFRAEGGMILATHEGFAGWNEGQPKPVVLWNPLPNRDDVRMNDGKVDPAGRFWAGSMDTTRCEGALYRLDPDGAQHTLLHNIGISNGLGWSPDRKTMYYTDSIQYTIFAFDYNLETGDISNQRPFIELPRNKSETVPDGLCVDAEGCIWSAHWNGWQVVRYDPQGKPILHIDIPAQQVTSCCFGGENLDQLFITTAHVGLSDEALTQQPHAGDIFIYQTDTRGQVSNFFGKPTQQKEP